MDRSIRSRRMGSESRPLGRGDTGDATRHEPIERQRRDRRHGTRSRVLVREGDAPVTYQRGGQDQTWEPDRLEGRRRFEEQGRRGERRQHREAHSSRGSGPRPEPDDDRERERDPERNADRPLLGEDGEVPVVGIDRVQHAQDVGAQLDVVAETDAEKRRRKKELDTGKKPIDTDAVALHQVA